MKNLKNSENLRVKNKIKKDLINNYDLKVLEELKSIFLIRDQYNKEGLVGNEKVIMNEIFFRYTKTEKYGTEKTYNHRSKMMYIISMVDFFQRKSFNEDTEIFKNFQPEIGEIYYANLLLGFDNELSFSHPVLILEKDQLNKKVFCVPLKSPKYMKDEFGKMKPVVNKDTQFLLKRIYSDLKKKDSLVLLNEPQTLSYYRLCEPNKAGYVLDKSKKNFNKRKEMFFAIKNKVFGFTNPKQEVEIIKLKDAVEKLNKELSSLKEDRRKNN